MASTAPTTGATTGDEVTVLPVTALVAELGEGPVWDSEHNKLMWVDIVGKRVLEFDPEQKGAVTTLGAALQALEPLLSPHFRLLQVPTQQTRKGAGTCLLEWAQWG